MGIWTRLQNLDRRILYVLIAIVLAVPLIMRPAKHPDLDAVFPEVRNAYDTINRVPKGKIVLLSTTWGAGTKAENEPQMEALMRHMFAKHIKFAIMSWDAGGSEITWQSAERIQKDTHAKYGEDWVHLGYKTGVYAAIASGLGEDFQKVFTVDRKGTKLSELPAVSYVKDAKQIGAVVDITSTGMMGIWIPYLTTPKHIPLIYCPTAVMAVTAYPYLDSGQLKGMMNGVMGAVQYETLIGRGSVATDASATSWALSCAHIYILLLILVGNLGYLAAKRAGILPGGSRIG